MLRMSRYVLRLLLEVRLRRSLRRLRRPKLRRSLRNDRLRWISLIIGRWCGLGLIRCVRLRWNRGCCRRRRLRIVVLMVLLVLLPMC